MRRRIGNGALPGRMQQPVKSGTGIREIRRNEAAIQGGEKAEWPRLVRALAIVDQRLTCK